MVGIAKIDGTVGTVVGGGAAGAAGAKVAGGAGGAAKATVAGAAANTVAANGAVGCTARQRLVIARFSGISVNALATEGDAILALTRPE